MAAAVRQSALGEVSGGTVAQANFGSATLAGSTLVIGVTQDDGVTNTISDSAGNTYTAILSPSPELPGAGDAALYIYECVNVAAGVTWVKVTTSGNSFPVIIGAELTGVKTASPRDTSAQRQGGVLAASSSPFVLTTGALAQANNIVLAFGGTGASGASTVSLSSPWTTLQQEQNNALYWGQLLASQYVTATTAVTASWNLSPFPVTLAAATVIYQEASGGGTSVSPAAGSLALSGLAPTLAQPHGVVPAAGAIALSGAAPTVAQPHGVTPASGALALSGSAPTLAQTANQSVTPGVGALTLAGYAPTLAQPHGVQPAAGALTLTAYAPALAQPHGLQPGAGALVLTGPAPTLAQTASQNVTPSAGTLALSGYAPALAQGAGGTVSPAAGSVAIGGYAPTLAQTAAQSVSPGAGALTLSGFAPALSQTSGKTVQPGAGALTLTGSAPSIAQPRTLTPAVGSLVLQGFAPAVLQPHGLQPSAGALTLGSGAPTLAQTANQSIRPGAGVLTLNGWAPAIAQASPYVWEYSERILRMLPDNRVMTMTAEIRIVKKQPEKRTIPPVPNYVRF